MNMNTNANISLRFSKHSPDFTEAVEKRIVAIGHIENDLDKKPLTRAVFHESCSKSSKELIYLFRINFGQIFHQKMLV